MGGIEFLKSMLGYKILFSPPIEGRAITGGGWSEHHSEGSVCYTTYKGVMEFTSMSVRVLQ